MRRDRRRYSALVDRRAAGGRGQRSSPLAAWTVLGMSQRLRRQRGFTLIEMLVVISILGILAAVVTLSMIGITNLAQTRANQGELMEVQSAMNFMITDQLVDPDQACSLYSGPSAGTNDMSRFPSTQPFQQSGGNLEQTSHQPVQLYPHYLRRQFLNRSYVCTGNGAVQSATGH
jgi:prepilin-type N-terminal cleavage/methylation domain-containing protein